jgi:hypothetical protein
MKLRTWKWVALVSCGAVVAQIASCGAIIADLLLQQVFVTVVRGIIQAVQAGTATA